MEVVLNDAASQEQQKITSLSYLDKGIDDMEAGRMYTIEDAFMMIRARVQSDV